MGLFANPLSYAGYPPDQTIRTSSGDATQIPSPKNTTVRAATFDEVGEGILANVYVSPATAQAEIVADFASPPPLGSTTPNTVAATTLTSSGNTTLATSGTATTFSALNTAPSGATDRTFNAITAASGRNDTVNFLTGINTANSHIFNVLTGASSAGTGTVNFFTGILTGGTYSFNVFTTATAGTLSVNIGTCDKNVTMNLGTGTGINVITLGSSVSQLGFFGATPVVKPIGTTDLKDALVNLGLYTDGGATPLNLDAGALSCGDLTAVGTVNINATGAGVTTIGTGGTGATNIGNATGNTSVTGSLTASTSLTATAGNITATNGNIVRGTAGNKDVYNSVASTTTAGANSAGTVTLAGGTATVSTTAVTAASIIRIYRQGIGSTGAAALGILTIGTIVAATSFVINSVQAADATALQASDVSVIAWEIVN